MILDRVNQGACVSHMMSISQGTIRVNPPEYIEHPHSSDHSSGARQEAP